MLKEILAVSGKPGLYRLISKGQNLLIVESLTDKKRIPAYARDKVISLGDISIYTDEDEVPIREVFTSVLTKEEGKPVSIDLAKATTDELRAYLETILPNFDRERVYPSDIKKLLKWYEILIANGITDFSEKVEEAADESKAEAESESTEEEKDAKTIAKAKGASKTTKAASAKRKDSSLTAAKSVKATKAKPTPKTATPKKSVVGAKRGS